VNPPLLAIVLALLGWWLSTGIILYLNLLPRSTHRYSVGAFAATAALGLAALPEVSAGSSTTSVLAGFAIALLVWGALEISYLMGFLTGSNKRPCREGARGWERFRLALATSLHHELAVIAAGLAIYWLTLGGNPAAVGTYLTLWLMRWSAKLNLYLGVSNFNEHWLPARNRYLLTYMRKRSMNALMPFSIGISGLVAAQLAMSAATTPEPAQQLALSLVCTLLVLAIAEHIFLVVPLRDSALWQWAISAAGRARHRAAKELPRPSAGPNEAAKPGPATGSSHG
jgi:putative photosynthetic complex assembly protein 2